MAKMDFSDHCRSKILRYFILLAAVQGSSSFVHRNLPQSNVDKVRLQRQAMGMVMTSPAATESSSSEESEPIREKPSALVRAEEWFASAVTERRSFAASVLEPLTVNGAEVLSGIERLPTRKDEPYRYSDLESLYRNKYTAPTGQSEFTEADIQPYLMEKTEGRRLVFVDGVMDEQLSDVSALPDSVFVGSVSQVPQDQLAPVLEKLSFIPEMESDHRTTQGSKPFAALNLACLADAAVMLVPEKVTIEDTIQALFVSTSNADQPSFCNHRLLVVADEGAKLNFVQNSIGKGSKHLSNGMTRVIVDEDAQVKHLYLQEQPEQTQAVETVHSQVAQGGQYNITAIAFGGDKARLNIQVELNGEEAFGEIEGAMIGGDQQNLQQYTSIKHGAESTVSRQQQRNIVGGSSDIVFKGRIRVEQIAQETNSDQLCRSLMLSDTATVTAMPSMEIIADQVKCTHGATVADMSEEDTFYFQSRGISQEQARNMMVLGFANEIAEKVSCKNFRDRLNQKISTAVPKESSRDLTDYDFTSI